MPGCLSACGCLQGVLAVFRVPIDFAAQREDFESIVAFLATVPLLRKQLPRSELPKVAQQLTRREWKPGQVLVRQGETGRALFLIMSGKARVVVKDGPNEPERTRCELAAGDYFGGHTLITSRSNVATIIVSDDCSKLVTLSMSRTTFEESGLRRWLDFPKRPAIYDASDSGGQEATKETGKTPDEEEFIRSALVQNANFRSLLQWNDEKLRGIAAAAERREVKKGTTVAQIGEVGHEFFIIAEGAFSIDLTVKQAATQHSSAETLMARSSMAERLIRKQTFLQALHAPTDVKVHKSAMFADSARSRSHSSVGIDHLERRSLTRLASGSVAEDAERERSYSSLTPLVTPPAGAAHRAAKQPRQGKRQVGEGGTTLTAMSQVAEEDNMVIGQGESFGELSLLYNTRREASFVAKEDSVVYVVGRAAFMRCVEHRDRRFTEWCKVLDEVHALTSLLSAERFELACNAHGVVNFKPNERVITMRKVREARLWYVVLSGSGIQSTERTQPDGSNKLVPLAQLRRASHFGERSLLRGDLSSQTHVDAGPEGMACVTFAYERVEPFLRKVFVADEHNNLPSLDSDIEEYIKHLQQGWQRSSSDTISGKKQAAKVQFENLIKVCSLGRGGFCQVSLVMDSATKKRYALKTLSKGYIVEKGAERQIRWERELLSMVNCPFIIKLHHTYTDEQHIYFLLEAALGGCLADVINQHPEVLHEDEPRGWSAAFYIACIASALAHLHERKIVHRDVKPENALLDEHGYAKLCDMGFARFVLGKTSTLAGTPEYMAPEIIDFPHKHDTNVDWWGLGILTFEMLAGQTPFEDEGIVEPRGRLLAIRRSQEQGKLMYPFNFPHAAKSFVGALLQKLPHRLGAVGGASDVMAHPMFTRVKFNFEEFHGKTMKSPYAKEWDESAMILSDDLGMDTGYLGLDPGDSIFFPAAADRHVSFERELS